MDYKVTYIADTMTVAFVRVADDAILFNHANEQAVIDFAKEFGKPFWIE